MAKAEEAAAAAAAAGSPSTARHRVLLGQHRILGRNIAAMSSAYTERRTASLVSRALMARQKCKRAKAIYSHLPTAFTRTAAAAADGDEEEPVEAPPPAQTDD